MAAIRPNPTLPEDVISEILKRVPVKSLLCFQSVCKNWLSLIKHPAFVKSQFLHAVKTLTHQTLIINETFISSKNDKLSLLSVDSHQIVADLKFPYSPGESGYAGLVGSANGIVCVVNIEYPQHKTRTSTIYLWNPAIRQSKLIPPYSMCGDMLNYGFGFGYDEIEQDFKVFSIISYESGTSFCAEVYSDNRNTWRKVPDPIDCPDNNIFDVCVNGFLCGIGGKHDMMAFDLNKEVLNCAIKLPDFSDDDDARIIEFNNSVAVIILTNKWYHPNQRMDEKINLLTLDDDACLCGGGVEASWTPMFSVDIVRPRDIDMFSGITFGYISNGDLVLLILVVISDFDDYLWISCNADKKEAKIVPFSVDMAYYRLACDVQQYTESLVTLAGFKQCNWDGGEDDN